MVKVSLREIQLILAAARKWLQFRGSGQLSKTDCKTCPIFSEHEMLSCKTALQRPLETNHRPPTFPLLTKESFHGNNCRKQKKQLRLDMPDQTLLPRRRETLLKTHLESFWDSYTCFTLGPITHVHCKNTVIHSQCENSYLGILD